MNKKKLLIIVGIIFSVLITIFLLVGAALLYRENDKIQIINTTQKWANLEEFPKDAEILSVEKSGSSFSREFNVSFKLSEKEIRYWLRNSPGTKGIIPEINNEIEIYSIKPSEGAQFAEIKYDTKTNIVYIRVYWS